MSGSDPHGTCNADSDRCPKTESDGWGLWGVTGSRVSRMGESRWMKVDSQIVVDRHRCLSRHPSRCLSRARYTVVTGTWIKS